MNRRSLPPWARWSGAVLLVLLGAFFTFHLSAQTLGKMHHRSPDVPRLHRSDEGPLRVVGASTALRRQDIWEVHLRGSAPEIGWAHTQLLRDRMLSNEAVLQGALHKYLPSPLLRSLVLDWAALEYRSLDDELSPSRKNEMAASALAFQPDPFASLFPTYQRFVYLNTLYDISLSFEHSPLVGCTSFVVSAEDSSTGGPLLARVFDFEVDEIFDVDKAVFIVKEDEKIPFASIAWPGLVGVVTGINANGLALVVHGARAGPVVSQGTPVLHAMRRVLSEASNTQEAIDLLTSQPPLVSHLVVLQDKGGHAVVLERSVHQPGFVRTLERVAAITNHFEGPLKSDTKNQRVRGTTSTLARRARADALIKGHHGVVSPAQTIAWLRDRKDELGRELPIGDRRAIDALIATHAVVFDTRSGRFWVSRGPRMMGAFVEFDLNKELAGRLEPQAKRSEIPEDPARAALMNHMRKPSLP